ncbi:MAG: hypothetical protein KAJ65_07800, partial [Gammaproteobacteria bacterium]|nr:hypothetical protein [Gammaproteobacteria bacterium]
MPWPNSCVDGCRVGHGCHGGHGYFRVVYESGVGFFCPGSGHCDNYSGGRNDDRDCRGNHGVHGDVCNDARSYGGCNDLSGDGNGSVS